MSSSSEVPLQLWDPVSVESSAAQALQGVVAHLGPVEFAAGTSDFVGIRLTGPSVGLGKNNGTVEGHSYFDAGSNSGLFVRYSSGKITKRKLSRLQELQLKRELGIKSTATAAKSSSASATTPGSKVPPRSVPKTPGSASGATRTKPPTTGDGGKLSRLEAIRRRREEAAAATAAASAKANAATAKTPTTTTSTRPKSSSSRDLSQGDDDSSVASGKSGASSLASGSVGRVSESRATRLEELKAEREARVLRSASGKSLSSIPRSSSKSRQQQQRPVSSVSHPRTPGTSSSKQSLASTFSSEAEQASLEYKEKWKEAEEELQRQGQEIQQLKASFSEASSKNEAHEMEIDKLRTQLETKEQELLTESVSIPSPPAPDSEPQLGPSQGDYDAILADKEKWQSKAHAMSSTVESLRREMSTNKAKHSDDISLLKSELLSSRSRALAAEKETDTIHEQAAAKSTNAAGHMKERAKMASEISALHRRIVELEEGQTDHETMMEEVALDKEALQEEKEELQDQLQESAMEITSLQVELEEAKVELDETKLALDDARHSAASAAAAASGEVTAQEGGNSSTTADAQDVSRALSTQNGRLREALVRLREQANFEKVQLSKQLRDAEKDAAAGRALQSEVELLRDTKAVQSNEIKDLKEMVDTNAMYETMVEELSDKVTNLEDENIEFRNAVRDLEEAGEMAEEMEEVQAEEIKTIRRDVESREATVRTLEEAIKMQRRREIDLQKAVGNYRSVIDTLKQEKASLLELREGGEGEKNQLIAASQRALAQASQLVSDQEARRKREAAAVFDKINAQVGSYLALRLESLLPGTTDISAEIAATKGELLMSKVIAKGSVALNALTDRFSSIIGSIGDLRVRSSVEFENLAEGEEAPGIHLDDETFQTIESLLFEGRCSGAIIDASAACNTLLLTSQWPGVLSLEESREVGSAAIGPASIVDNNLNALLRSLKEEDQLSPHRSSVDALLQSTKEMKLAMIDNADESYVPDSIRKNTCCSLVRDASSAKFTSQAAFAAIAAAIRHGQNDNEKDVSTPLSCVMEKMERATKEIDRTMPLVAVVSYLNSDALVAAAKEAANWKATALTFLLSLQWVFKDEKILVNGISESESAAEKMLKTVVRLSTLLKEAGLAGKEGVVLHHMSPENSDPWQGLAAVSKEELGDEADALLFHKRAEKVEQMVANAFESQSSLSVIRAKADSLEKTLASRSQEIAMQTARMAELEKLLAQASLADPKVASPQKPKQDAASLEALSKLTEENRVLSEAIDVLHAQVDEYEAEIRSLKEAGGKSVSTRRGGLFTPKGKGVSVSDLGSTLSLLGQDTSEGGVLKSANNEAALLKLEASLFRPALREANADAAAWRAKSISRTMSSLKPLSVPPIPIRFTSGTPRQDSQPQEGQVSTSNQGENCDNKTALVRCKEELILASMQARLTMASTKLVGVELATNTDREHKKTSRFQLRKMQGKEACVTERLKIATASARQRLVHVSNSAETGEGVWSSPVTSSAQKGVLAASVTLQNDGGGKSVPVVVNRSDLSKLHTMLLQ